MWKTVNSVYKSANKNIKKIGKNIPSISTVSQTIQNIKLPSLLKSSNNSNKQQSNKPSQNQQYNKSLQSQKQLQELSKTLKSIFQNKKPVMPINKMNYICQLSYKQQYFTPICQQLINQISTFKYQSKLAKQTLNIMVLICYLIKNAPTAFVDQFRLQLNIFKQHSQLDINKSYINDNKQIDKLKPLLIEIKQRSIYITALLTNKQKLLKEKQISMEIKKKIVQSNYNNRDNKQNKQYRDNEIVNKHNNNEEKGQRSRMSKQRVEQFLQHYVWKYWNKFDQKMQNITQRIIQKIDEYLDLQQPQSFQIDQVDQQQQNKHNNQQNNNNNKQSRNYNEELIELDDSKQKQRSTKKIELKSNNLSMNDSDNNNNKKDDNYSIRQQQQVVKMRQMIYLKQKNDLDMDVNKQLLINNNNNGPILNTDLV